MLVSLARYNRERGSIRLLDYQDLLGDLQVGMGDDVCDFEIPRYEELPFLRQDAMLAELEEMMEQEDLKKRKKA